MIDTQHFAEYQSEFLKFFPNGESFQLPQYIERERAYKQELADIFACELAHCIQTLPEGHSDRLALANETIGIFKKPLKTAGNKPQNLMGFRYWNFLAHLSDENRVTFLLALNQFLYGDAALSDRVDQFVAFLESVPSHTDWPYSRAAGRAIYSFYLFMADPQKHIYIHTTMVQSALRSLKDEALPQQAGGAGYNKVLTLANDVKKQLEADGWQPKDMIDIHSFLWVRHGYEDESNTIETIRPTNNELRSQLQGKTMIAQSKNSLNLIMYGPPGTGKTYHTVNRALDILDSSVDQTDRVAMKNRFDELTREGRIASVTFHQSFSYEDFVEGLKATSEDGQIKYEVEDGVFKTICSLGQANIEIASKDHVDTSNKTVWKMSLGDTQGSDAYIYEYCIENNEIRLGYGRDIDFTNATSRQTVIDKYVEEGRELKDQDYRVTAVNTFRNLMNIGDLVVVSDGNKKFRAIGEISGEYQCKPDEALGHYGQTRNVVWHRVWDKSIPYDQLLEKSFSQMTIYQLRPKVLRKDRLADLLGDAPKAKPSANLFSGLPLCNGNYHIVSANDQIVRVRVKKTGSVIGFDKEMLNELAGHIKRGELSIADIQQKKVFEKTDSNLEKYVVNGYPRLIAEIIDSITRPTSNEVKLIRKNSTDKVLIIDEINRGNIASILGELITLIEPSKRKGNSEAAEVILPYSKERFSVPNNLYIIGTMNTADRSLALLDTALRRRFEFEVMMPQEDLLSDIEIEGIEVSRLLKTMNHRIELLYDRDHLLGHSFFMGLDKNSSISDLRRIFERNILPTLEEYFFEDWTRIRQVLGDNLKQSSLQFLVPKYTTGKIENLLGDDIASEVGSDYYMHNEAAMSSPAAYIGIYSPE